MGVTRDGGPLGPNMNIAMALKPHGSSITVGTNEGMRSSMQDLLNISSRGSL